MISRQAQHGPTGPSSSSSSSSNNGGSRAREGKNCSKMKRLPKGTSDAALR
jgi:hypothetical protein